MKINILVGPRFQAKIVADALVTHFDVEIYTSSPPKNWHEVGQPQKNIRFVPMFANIIGQLLKFKPSRWAKDSSAIAFDLMATWLMRDADVLHFWSTFGLASAKKFKKNKRKLVVERACPHIFYQQKLLTEEADRLNSRFILSAPWMVARSVAEYQLADKIIVPSSYTYRSFIEQGFAPEQLALLPLDANFHPQKQDYRQERAIRPESFVVGFVGGSVLRKGLLYLLQAWQQLQLPNSRLLIKTSLYDLQTFPAIQKIIESNPTIELVGYLSSMEDFYAQCDVFCLPSIDDGFGMVVFESLACGVPVIVSENVGAADLIEEGVTGFKVPIRSPDAIANNLQVLHSDLALRETMQKNCRIFYQQYQISDQHYSARVHRFYSELQQELS